MKKKEKVEKWFAGVLLVALALVVVHLVTESDGVHAGSARSASPPVSSRASRSASAAQAAGDPVDSDFALRLDTLKSLDNRPMPDLARSPFEYGPTPDELKARKVAEEIAKHPPPPPPPPPPPINLKAFGFQQDDKGKFRAYLSDDQDTYIVQEGQEFAKRFKVLKITSSNVEIEDETYHQTVQLPFAQ